MRASQNTPGHVVVSTCPLHLCVQDLQCVSGQEELVPVNVARLILPSM